MKKLKKQKSSNDNGTETTEKLITAASTTVDYVAGGLSGLFGKSTAGEAAMVIPTGEDKIIPKVNKPKTAAEKGRESQRLFLRTI